MITIAAKNNLTHFTTTAENILHGLNGHNEECIIIQMNDIRWPVSKRHLKDLCLLYKKTTLNFEVTQVRNNRNELVDSLCISGYDSGVKFTFNFNFAGDIFVGMAGGYPKQKRLGECQQIGMTLFDCLVNQEVTQKPEEVTTVSKIELPKPKRKYTRKPQYIPTWQEKAHGWVLRVIPRLAISFII